MNQKFSDVVGSNVQDELGFLYERLLINLDQELSLQQSLLELLGEERATLVRASSFETIQEANARKEALLLKGKENSIARQEIIHQVCTMPGWEGETVTLSRLTDYASDENVAQRLRQRQQALSKLVKEIRLQNNRNIELINAAIGDVQGALHLIQSMVAPAGNYQKTGQVGLTSMQGSLIHREG